MGFPLLQPTSRTPDLRKVTHGSQEYGEGNGLPNQTWTFISSDRSSTGHCVDLACQQKGQYVPGQQGLNVGVVPEPGIDVIDIGNRPTYNSELTRL